MYLTVELTPGFAVAICSFNAAILLLKCTAKFCSVSKRFLAKGKSPLAIAATIPRLCSLAEGYLKVRSSASSKDTCLFTMSTLAKPIALAFSDKAFAIFNSSANPRIWFFC